MRQVPIVTALVLELLDSEMGMNKKSIIKLKLNVDCGLEGR